jgi:hypothetical protein
LIVSFRSGSFASKNDDGLLAGIGSFMQADKLRAG